MLSLVPFSRLEVGDPLGPLSTSASLLIESLVTGTPTLEPQCFLQRSTRRDLSTLGSKGHESSTSLSSFFLRVVGIVSVRYVLQGLKSVGRGRGRREG